MRAARVVVLVIGLGLVFPCGAETPKAKLDQAVFENPNHDFPRRVSYRLNADGSLTARIEGTRGGKPASKEWTWRRAAK